jgi:hypothetical protein
MVSLGLRDKATMSDCTLWRMTYGAETKRSDRLLLALAQVEPSRLPRCEHRDPFLGPQPLRTAFVPRGT